MNPGFFAAARMNPRLFHEMNRCFEAGAGERK